MEHIKDLLALAEAIRQMTAFQIIAVLIGIYIFKLPAIMRERRQMPEETDEPMAWPELKASTKVFWWAMAGTTVFFWRLPEIITAAHQWSA